MNLRSHNHKMKIKKQINKFISDYGIPEYYKYYQKTVQYDKFESKFSGNTKLIVTKEEYNTIITDFFKKISERILKAEIIQFPSGLGNLSVRKKKMHFDKLLRKNKLRVDWGTFKKTGIKTYFTNDHTDGYYGSWVWDKSRCKIPTKTYYRFIPSRKNSRAITQVFKAKGDFTEVVYQEHYINKKDVNTETSLKQNSS